MKRKSLLLAVWLFAAGPALAPASAQDAATLIADRIFLTGTGTLTAEGHVEVFFEGAHLSAQSIVYDPATDNLTITGPVRLDDGHGFLLLADGAKLSRDMTDGILESARLMIDQQMQIAANSITREAGRYTRMERIVASACEVCPANPVPLWEIRANKVVHDQEERQLYFDQAQFRIMGVPVFYTPWLRMPDPTLDRATGFLLPRVRSTSTLGTGVKLPYFIAIGESRDLTLTPYLSSGTTTLELRYRQAFVNGQVTVEGAVSRDDILPDEDRGYLFGTGRFRLQDDFILTGELRVVSDPAYLLDYGISDEDRLRTGVDITRTRRNEYIHGSIANYHSIREGESNSTTPTMLGALEYERRFSPFGGEGGFRFQTRGFYRPSDIDTDANGDGVTDGRDVARASLGVDWRRNWVLGNGILASGMFDLSVDFYSIAQDESFPGTVTRATPTLGAELRWPLLKSGAGGAVHVLEPVAQMVWTPESSDAVPNEDSALVEFDEGNLFSLDRFAGIDLRERGLRTNLGLSWTRYDPDGWSMTLTGGRVWRDEDLGQFTESSGLSGTLSDWLISGQVQLPQGLTFVGRALFDDDLSLTRNSLSLSWQRPDFGVSTSYLMLEADPAEDRGTDTSELWLAGSWQVSDGWRARVEGRHDFTASRTGYAGLGLEYRTECALIDLSLSRRFTSSTSVTPTTDFNLSVTLGGIGSGYDGRSYRRSCAR
ncbi:LPS assembly protein LptD [Defluviimonas sp. WL0002]|uniref:LPS-assembly protein LptD n=1 Tax=Albidovulum marisflavi TaxID=2984159 RepID=A0ABT2ZH93_9RHOB|nr:LPS assembly protein LptD [Defluviimonas sp. WL0002]MCV2870508.1 LPS assembly protein LptD [Defluviimonas sp. WL0002]